MKATPLREEHERLGAKMVDFAGWLMPVEYKGLRQEHLQTREHAGVFDVSHMGEIRVRGDKAFETLQWLTSNDISRLSQHDAQYSLLPNEKGGLVDDIIVYCLEPKLDYLLCVNASNKDKDLAWIKAHNRGAEVVDESDRWGQIAVQGPKARELCGRILGAMTREILPFQFMSVKFSGESCLVARTGYTGEDGFEIFLPPKITPSLWRALLDVGKDLGVAPVGLGARDTLRTEMKYPLYGHEIDETTNPYSAGLGWVVKSEAKDFLGREVILQNKTEALRQKLVGFIMSERGIPRQGYKLFSFDNKEIGRVTSGTVSPTLNENIGIGYVDAAYSDIGSIFYVEIRSRKVQAKVVKTPFVATKRSP